MPSPLAQIYSTADTFKRKLADALRNPGDAMAQFVGHANDRARNFNELTSAATQETVNALRSGGDTNGPASQKLAGVLADAYNPAGMVVWHGSPHKFSKFDSSKIGTGEGAQAYGHGLYFAENPGVASGYQKALSGVKPEYKPSGYDVNGWWAQAKKLYPNDKAKQEAWHALAQKSDWSDPVQVAQWGKDAAYSKEAAKVVDDVVNDIYNPGSLYKVDLPDDAIAKMLDWDKPLSQQPHVMDLINKQEAARTQAVLDQRLQTLANVGNDAPNAATLKRQIEILREEVANPQGSGLGSMTGGEYYNYLRRRDVPPSEQANMFNGAGIPGIRYLDGGSRGAGGGTSNFVVFPGNESMLQILERNGQPLGMMGIK